MPHMLIVGASGTGKTTLAKRLAEARLKSRRHLKNYRQVALDPLFSDWPEGVTVVPTFPELEIELEIMKEQGEFGNVIVDESNIHFAHAEKQNLWLPLRGRHQGLDITMITQFPTLISPAARGQCEQVHAFRIGLSASKLLADDFAAPALLEAANLRRGEWLATSWGQDGHRQVSRYLLFSDNKNA